MKSPFYEIWLVVGSENINITDYIDSFDYEDCLNEDDMLTLKIQSNNFEFLDKKEVAVGKFVLFQFGYVGGLKSSLNKARITDIETTYDSLVGITIKCYDMGTVMKKTTEQSIWKNKKASDIAKEIAVKYGLEAEVEETKKTYDTLPQGSKTDFQFLQYLANMEENGSFRFFVKDNTLYFNKKNLKQDAKRLYIYKDNSATATMISFKPALRESSQKSSSEAVNIASFNPLKQEIIEVKLDNANTKEDVRLGNSVPRYDVNGNLISKGSKSHQKKTKEQKNNASNSLVSPEFSITSLQDKAHSKKKKQSEKILTATLTIEGDPTLRADEIITILGVAKMHSGNWYIEKIKHTISSSGYITTLELLKNAINTKGTGLAINNSASVVALPNGTPKNETQGQINNSSKKTIPRYDANGNKL
ncbi:MAG: hypothetical protein OHK0045_22860 [Raineya sp.]